MKSCSVDPIDEHHVHRPARDLLSDAHVGLVRRWMDTCEAEHETCLKHSGSLQDLPTRLLKIEERDGEEMGTRLVDKSDVEGTYACLSYCWGSNSQLSMTTTANRNEYRHSVPWQELPPTIRDSIKLCHELGFEYVWVDSLCIVQDDQQDWLREASDMARIYSRSGLTLAIHLCDDASESFLQKRLLDAEQWSDGPLGCARISVNDSNTVDSRDMYFWQDESFKGSRFLDLWWRSITDLRRDGLSGEWLNRAWTFQEWFLSPRVLHIHAMTVWDCFDSRGNELEDRFLGREGIPRAFPGIDTWPLIVEDFTSRQISMEKDRLPALAGLAERFQAQTGYVYLAGLWLEALPRSLIWTRRYHYIPMRRPLAYRAPTWSWAALEGEVFFPCDRFYEVSSSNVVGHHCQYNPPDSFATVTDGWIDIEGSMNGVRGWVMHDEDSWVSDIRLFTHDQLGDIQNPQYWIATLDEGQNLKEEIRLCEIHLLEVLTATPLEYKNTSRRRRYGLLLKTLGPNRTGQDCFQRVGIAYMDCWSLPISPTKSWARRTIRLV